MVTVDDIENIINGMRDLKYYVAAKNKIASCSNQFKVKMPITGKEMTVSIPQSDIDALDTKITNKKNQLKDMWKVITW